MMILGPGPHLLHVLGGAAVHGDRLLEVAGVRAAHCHRPPHKAGIVGESKSELGGGAQAREENILQVDEGSAERAVEEGRHQGAGEDVSCPAGERGEDVERVELDREEPLAGRVPDGHRVHDVPDDGVVKVGVHQRSARSLNWH